MEQRASIMSSLTPFARARVDMVFKVLSAGISKIGRVGVGLLGRLEDAGSM